MSFINLFFQFPSSDIFQLSQTTCHVHCSTSAGLLVSSADLRHKLLLATETNSCWKRAEPQTWDAGAAATAVKQMPLLCHEYVKPLVHRPFENSYQDLWVKAKGLLNSSPKFKSNKLYSWHFHQLAQWLLFFVLVVECIQLWTGFHI